ncbi:type VI secretion system baseplate subunit TssK [Paludisphaera mucosa]|uniref:Type VI secretion system baseplate subunit TssK n=1 Tax=Paludisphaera mucosa TaxID=3030827 RepID=A0ABT6FE03_9BACT|nr:type VI secretion system baseplate subunit TssK [Paludisphaera mucosa]MDG3005790.1 type VI secretion system baseplate subunit TssK [Paludisphaera mucosa]
MPKRPVHWFEGMFLKPHHFQAAERWTRERIRESEDWLQPHDWGVRSIEFDADAIANRTLRVTSCQARFKDGTTVSIPDEAALDPVELGPALARRERLMVYLAVPAWQPGRPNAQREAIEDAPRFLVGSLECPDENTGGDEEEIEFRNLQARLLLEDQLAPGFETLPIARIERAGSDQAPPRVDRSYVPPVLGLDAWRPLHDDVQALFRQVEAWIDQEASQVVGRKIAFDSQVLGDAERILRLSALNTAYAAWQGFLFTRGLHPLAMYGELCRLLGQLAIFGESRRPVKVPSYDHDDIGPCYAVVLAEIRRLLGSLGRVPFERRYFQLEGPRFQVALEPDWTLETTKLYIGVETAELTDAECDALMKSTDWKLGSGEQVETIFKSGGAGLGMKPLNRIPPALPGGVVYFEIVRNAEPWKDVVRTRMLGLRFKLERGKFLSAQMLALTNPTTQRTVNLQFAVFVVKSQ